MKTLKAPKIYNYLYLPTFCMILSSPLVLESVKKIFKVKPSTSLVALEWLAK